LAEPTAMQCAIFTASVARVPPADADSRNPPTIVIGHSLGEYAAYVAGGVLSFADGLAGVMARAETVIDVPADQRGTMLAGSRPDRRRTSHVSSPALAGDNRRGPRGGHRQLDQPTRGLRLPGRDRAPSPRRPPTRTCR
jgi:ABC-type glutathione transport system ATPase component